MEISYGTMEKLSDGTMEKNYHGRKIYGTVVNYC